MLFGAAAFVAAGIIALLWALPENAPLSFGSVAVLPFTSDSSETDYLADGLTEAVLNGLVQLDGLRVAPRASATRFKGSANPPRARAERSASQPW